MVQSPKTHVGALQGCDRPRRCLLVKEASGLGSALGVMSLLIS